MNEIRTFGDIKQAVIDRAKIEGTDIEVVRQVEEKINTTYQQIVYRHPYTWSGQTSPLLLPKKYFAGTITVTQNSDEIVGVSTAWVENDHFNLKMYISGSNIPYKIIRVGSSTTITLDQSWRGSTASGVSYFIYQDEFGLFPDLQSIRRITIPGLRPRNMCLPTGMNEIETQRSISPFSSGAPSRFSVWGKNFYRGKTWATFNIDQDFWEDSFTSQPRNQNLHIYPSVRTNDIYANVRYTLIANPMANDSDEPMIPFYNRNILVSGTLVLNFLQNRDIQTKREWEMMYKDDEKKMASDIETYDDELVLIPDQRNYNFSSSKIFSNDESNEVQ